MRMKQCLAILVVTLFFALILPVRFTQTSFTCGFAKCDNLGSDTSYMVDGKTWRWFGGYHMSLWQHFTPKYKMQEHWIKYNYNASDVILLLSVAFLLATTVVYASTKRRD